MKLTFSKFTTHCINNVTGAAVTATGEIAVLDRVNAPGINLIHYDGDHKRSPSQMNWVYFSPDYAILQSCTDSFGTVCPLVELSFVPNLLFQGPLRNLFFLATDSLFSIQDFEKVSSIAKILGFDPSAMVYTPRTHCTN
jgi:hypothetical protein